MASVVNQTAGQTLRGPTQLLLLALCLIAPTAPTALAQSSFETPAAYYEDASQRLTEDDVGGAIIQLKNALQLDKSHLPSLLLLGQAQLLNGRADEAVLTLSDAMLQGADPRAAVPQLVEAMLREGQYSALLKQITPSQAPDSVRAEVEAAHAQAYVGLSRLPEANLALNRAQALDANNLRARLVAVTLHLRKGETGPAMDTAQNLIEQAPRDTRSWNSYGSVLHLTGQLEEAIAAYQRAVELASRNIDARIALVSLLMDLDRNSQAQPHITFVTENYPYEPRGAYFAALAAAQRGDREAELESLNLAASILDALPPAQVNGDPQLLMIGALANFGLGAFDVSRRYVESYRVINPDDLGAQRLLATTLLALGEEQVAAQLLLQMRRSAPDNPQVIALLASAYEQEGQYNRAAQLLMELEGAGSGTLDTDRQLGISLLNAGDLSSGIATLEAVRRAQPNRSGIDTSLALAYLRAGRATDALAIVDAALAGEPDNENLQNLQAVALLRAGRQSKAIERFTAITASTPEFVPARVNLSQIYREQGDLDAAAAVLEPVLAGAEVSPQVLYERARLDAQLGNTDEARRLAEQALAEQPGNAAIGRFLVRLHIAANDEDAAEEAARSVARNSASFESQALLGQTLAALNKPSQAALVYTQMVRSADFNTPVLYRIAVLQSDIGAYGSALYALSNGLRGNAMHQPSRRAELKMLLALDKADQAARRAGDYRQDYPSDPGGYLAGAEAALRTGDYGDAEALFTRATELDAEIEGTLGIARTQMTSGALRAAERTLTDYLTRGDDLRLLAAYSDLLMGQQRWADADATLSQILEQAPDSVAHLNNRALARFAMDAEGALPDAKRAQQLAPENPDVNDTLGWLLTESGDPAAALPYLREAATRRSDSPTVRYHLGATLAALGRTREALAELYFALEQSDSFAEAAAARQLQADLEKL